MAKKIIKVQKPSIRRKDLEYVLECMIGDNLEYGFFANKFEAKLSDRVHCNKVFAINSFYSTIELVLTALGVGSGDEVILPSFAPQVYINVLLHRGAVPVLVDLENEHSFKPSVEGVKAAVTEKTKALFLLYHFGFTYPVEPYAEIVPNIIEDITSVLGKKWGETTQFAIADFSARGLITTGEGGAVCCKGRKASSTIKRILEIEYFYNEDEEYTPRYACLMSDLNAAMGVSQHETLNHRLKLRASIGKIYEEAISKSRNSFIHSPEEDERFFSEFPLIVKGSLKDGLEFLKKNKIEAMRPFSFPLHHYLKFPKSDFANTERFYLKTLLIPINSTLLRREVNHISKALTSML